MVRDDLRSNEKEEFNNVFATIYNVELLFEEEPFFLIDRIAEELNEICGKDVVKMKSMNSRKK
ncbi:hypothetical protein [Lysinibacillus odysseyi]|uniref:Uncharacterized protein n=1 Tax=Lysinibacillus odysseyi 34hs-1 = NBRC 100172 TaxID=1220589 RepID=A0A0A3JB57_9BACI|nr:hypothetical protein [Lysinibacillus odysseyi]KGR84252.1 hypothetical protein CD32_11630 [Lysinibacillus odysseyi 34hs-1 = NBRC 100172]